MNRIAIVYYSMSGNTDYIAKKISKRLNVDLVRIYPKKDFPTYGLKKFVWGGKSAIMKESPDLEDYNLNFDNYDSIIIGTPVWASTFSPPIRTFIKDNINKIINKKLYVFLSYGGMGADKTINKLKEFIGISKFEAELVLVDPKNNIVDDNETKIEEFCKKIEGVV